MAFKLNISILNSSSVVSAIILIFSLALTANAASETLQSIPGAQTATGVLASSSDGMSRYLAPDGPIQPALTAIGGLPMRGTEHINNGITHISSGLNNGAQRLSNAAGNNGDVSMPGMQALSSAMPASVSQLGTAMQGAIRAKNQFISGQAHRGVEAGERLRDMMQNGLQSRSDGGEDSMQAMASMMGNVQETLKRSGTELKNQLQQSMSGHMSRLEGVQGIGQNVVRQARGIGQTLQNGLSNSVENLQRTGQQVHSQIQNGLKQNMGSMSNIMGSMQGSMGNMGQNMQKNLKGVVQHAQQAAQQVGQHIHQAAQGPLNMVQNLGSGLGKMMSGGMNVQSSGGKKY